MILSQSPQFARDLRAGEEGAVDALLRAAFGGEDEVQLVHKLRKSRAMAGEVVLPMDDRIIGYYALSTFVKPKGWLCLAPVAIHPDLQRRGYGKRMMGMLTEWARLTQTPVVVLGNPEFYEKAGFSREKAAKLQTRYSIENTMLAGVDASVQAQQLVYPAAFDGL